MSKINFDGDKYHLINRNPIVIVGSREEEDKFETDYEWNFQFLRTDSPQYVETMVRLCIARDIDANMHTPTSTLLTLLDPWIQQGEALRKK